MGAYQVGVLRYIHEHFAVADRSPFQVFAGISCGSINAAFYATVSHRVGWGSQRLVQLWEDFHVPQYHRKIGQLLRASAIHHLFGRPAREHRYWSVLDPTPMRELFTREIDRNRLLAAFQCGTTQGLAIAAKDATRNLTTWFVEGPRAVEWQRPHAAGQLQPLGPEHVVASCSVPFYFPPVPIEDRLYYDGAVHLERPFAAAISMGATRILGISSSTPRSHRRTNRPASEMSSIESVLRSMLSVYNHDFMPSEVEQINVLNRFSELIRRKKDVSGESDAPFNAVFDTRHQPTDYVPIAMHLVTPSKPIRLLADEFRRKHKGMGKGLVPVGLLFHRDFTPTLIRLGYQDAQAQHEDLAEFFGTAQPKPETLDVSRESSIVIESAAPAGPGSNTRAG
jgi:NTE family protein